MYIGQNIRFLRKRKGLNQTQLGEHLGITKGAVSGYESGASLPGVETLIKVAELLEVSLDELVFQNIELEGSLNLLTRRSNESNESTLIRLNQLLEERIKTLEREIRNHAPELAKELGLE